MMLKNSDISFSDRGMGYGDWKENKDEFSGDLPVWYFADDEDKWYYQRGAIMHMLGEKCGRIPKTPKETFRMEFANECYADFINSNVLDFSKSFDAYNLSDDQVKAFSDAFGTLCKRIEEMVVQGESSQFLAGD